MASANSNSCSPGRKVADVPVAPDPDGRDFVSIAPLRKVVSERSSDEVQREKEAKEFHDDFVRRTGWTPKGCYRLVLLSIALKILAGSWMGMAMLEYVRYYVINDLNTITILETATGSPQSFVKAFLFPFWGVASDRASRKSVLVAASVASCCSAWLLSLCPSVGVVIFTRCLSVVGDIGGSIRNAMLRDLFTPAQWEQLSGGITGIKSRMAVFGTVVAAVATAVGMGLLWLGDAGLFGLPNEYTLRKDDCKGMRHCVPPGQYSWDGGWEVDGSLRVLMLMGSVCFTLEMLVVVFLLPETLRPEYRSADTMMLFVRKNWRSVATPWNNLRVFATPQLRSLLSIRTIHYIIGTGMMVNYMSWYRRHELATLEFYSVGVTIGVIGFFTLFFVIRIVQRYGDLLGVWVGSKVLSLGFAISACLIPTSVWQLSYLILPLLMGPAMALGGFQAELLAKLIPPDIQGTFQTAKAFVYDTQRAVFVWPWLGLFVISDGLPYPLDTLPIWVSLVLGLVALYMTFWELKSDPKEAIEQGRALEPFWKTEYYQGRWYRKHGGREQACVESGADAKGRGPVPEWQQQASAAEGASKAGLILAGVDDIGLQEYLRNIARSSSSSAMSLSVVFCFLDGDGLFDKPAASPSAVARPSDGEAAPVAQAAIEKPPLPSVLADVPDEEEACAAPCLEHSPEPRRKEELGL